MPWCDECSKFWNPNSMPPDGTCPTCGTVIADPPDQSVPWHFWLLIAGVVIYLGWRYVQLFQWLVGDGHTAVAVVLGAITAALVAWVAIWYVRREPPGSDPEAGA